MNHVPSEDRFDELYQKYWDDRLTETEATEFTALLENDPLARDWFRMNGLHAVAAADFPAIPAAPPARNGWSRRRILQYLGGGLAASTLVGILGRKILSGSDAPVAYLREAKGGVTVTTESGKPLPPDGPLPADATVVTHGTNSSALLVYPNGSDVLLTGDTSVSFTPETHHLRLTRGSAIADIQPTKMGERPLSFHTAEAICSAVGGVLLTLTHAGRATEVGVHTGQVAVTDPTGAPLDCVRDGELFTVRADGRRTKQVFHRTAEEYELDLTEPLPDGWFVGKKFDEPSGPVVRPELWYDPYHKAEMYQIRSHHRWARGLFRMQAESTVNVRYRVQSSGKGQVCLVSRTETMRDAATGVLEWNGRYENGGPDGWQTLTVRAADMLDCKEAPKFRAPWVTFLFIFNTYGSDLGLEVAEFRVSRPGEPVEG